MAGDERLAEGIPARLTPGEGRRFGLTVGLAFLVLATISLWRGHTVAPYVLGTAGALLVVAGLLVPARLGPVHGAWMGFALLLSKVTTPVFMALMYFVVFTPTGLLMRLFGKNPLRSQEREGSFWMPHDRPEDPAGSLTRQF